MAAMHDDVAEFALLLTRLKERTDRSYAALGRRLSMNASTLHRYCAGDAVPLNFTDIERFAALCGASPEDRVELHRRWVLAVAARQRSRPSPARRAPTPHGRTSTAAPTAAASHSSSSDGASKSPSDEAPESPSDAPEPTSPTDPRPAQTSPTDPRPALPSLPSPADRRPHATRPRRRPLRWTALAASLAVALAGLTASAAGRQSGGVESSASPRTTPKTSAPATHSGGSPRSAAGPRSGGGETSDSARPTPTPSAPAPHSGDSPLRKDRSDAGTAPPSSPLTWTADSQLWQSECAHDYVIAKPPEQVPPPPTPADAAVWAASQQAVHGGTTDLRISVQGRGSAAVVLQALHVRLVNRTTPAVRRGIAYSMYEGCGAILVPRHFSVNLDARRPLARSKPGDDAGKPIAAVDFPYQVSLREPEVLLVTAHTESCTCDWYLDLDWSSEGRSGTVRVDDHGRPFRTTSIKGLPHYWYRHPAGWVPMTTVYDEEGTEQGTE
ncbi:helix-turn-helix domain-containing protein [Streptomyces sp. NPDC048751]|uniref:helix-turn-helix domain-containing protein n=1 Tax=Streptomyces sp. NPDC048751 TaxID=3365591 RepID=UPI003722307A